MICPRCPDEFRSDAALALHLRIHDLRDKVARIDAAHRPVSSEERREAEEGE